ncbi:phage tail protein [Rheinheimera sediminis]|uniref:phage tail protein n=1 Tax=Rheinheimera sp. YQF-1 TaxID=2499626 RepID=UPI000FDAAF53|nr:tail fiber protein [Rheinheimera sp. YQF-1]RVT48140.1 phage tail protein [Rheinheimera sp. YQF-1]
MSTPYVGEIKAVAYNFAPKYWSACDGQVLVINTNQALYSLLGVQFGGNGQTNFNLPDLRGRTPVCFGANPALNITYNQGLSAGQENVSLTLAQIPPHSHLFQASSAPATLRNLIGSTAPNSTLATADANYYNSSDPDTTLLPATVQTVGGQPHTNVQPSLALMYVIALTGLYPSRN